MAILTSKDFTAAKEVTSSGARADDHWIKSLMLYRIADETDLLVAWITLRNP